MNTKKPSIHPDSMSKENKENHPKDDYIKNDHPTYSQGHRSSTHNHVDNRHSHTDNKSTVDQPDNAAEAPKAEASKTDEQNKPTKSPERTNASTDSNKPRKQKGKDFVMPKGANKVTKANSEPSLLQKDTPTQSPTTQAKTGSIDRVRYLNGEKLSRPLEMPKQYKRKSYLIVLIAALIGAVFLYFYFDTTVNAPIREQKMMEERLEQDIALDLPNMISLLPMDDASITATLESSGATIFNKSAAQGNTSQLELIKLPEGVDLSQATAMYLKGINKLSGVEAATLLNGSWDLDVDRSKGMNMAIHYADFQSKTVDAAIQSALEQQGLDQTVLAESGVDNSGNTYASGNVDVDGTTYAWKISALPLNEVYSVNGLPDDAVYVGIRFTS